MSLTHQHIDTLLVLCKRNNHLAQLEVYKRYQKAMFNTALQIVKDYDVAEDVMQESFIAAFKKLDTFKGTATFGAWLKRIVVNNAISQHKKNSRFVSLKEEDINENQDDLNNQETYKNITSTQLKSCLEGINESYRQVLTLHYLEGFDYEELTEILNISYGSCRTLLSRAKNSLRIKLNTL